MRRLTTVSRYNKEVINYNTMLLLLCCISGTAIPATVAAYIHLAVVKRCYLNALTCFGDKKGFLQTPAYV